MAGLKGRDVLSLVELSPGEINLILKRASILARQKRVPQRLKGKTVAMIFQKPSTRTRISFETAVAQLGGHPIYLSWNEMQLGRGETISDTARVLDRYVDAIMARVYSHDDLVVLAENADAPIVNGLSDKHHPCQILADLLTLIQYKKRLKGLKLAYIASISIVEDPLEAVKTADAIYTDTFVSMGMEKEKETRLSTFIPKYQVNRELLSHAKPGAIFLHCLPAHRGEEVTDDVLDGPQSAVWDEAENRLHTAKGLLSLIL